MNRKRLISAVFATVLCSVAAFAQSRPAAWLQGIVTEEDEDVPVIQAAVQILNSRDSSMVNGTVTDNDGKFSIGAPAGNFIIKISYLGLRSEYRDIHVTQTSEPVDMGKIQLAEDGRWLEASRVTAKVPAVSVQEDTLVYSSAAFTVADDASIEDLLKRMPGIAVNGNNVTIYGRSVKKVLVNGKTFFGDDVITGLKNLPAGMVDKIKTYERQSDAARLSGVEDGEEETVVDLTIKKDLLEGWNNTINMAAGSHGRYAERLNSSKITKTEQTSIIGSLANAAKNTPGTASGQNQTGGGSRGDTDSRTLGLTRSKQMEKLDIGGSFNYSGKERDASSRSNSESLLNTSTSFGNSNSKALNNNHDLNFNGELEWHPDKTYSFICKPRITWSDSYGLTNTTSGNFNSDPSDITAYPNDFLGLSMDDDPLRDIRVNSSLNSSRTDRKNLNGNLYLFGSRRFAKAGRNLSASLTIGYNRVNNNSYSDLTTRYYRIKKNPDSTLVHDRFNETGNSTYSLTASLSYNEPISKKVSMQFNYTFSERTIRNTRNQYTFDGIFPGWTVEGSLPDGYRDYLDPRQSSDGRYRYIQNSLNASIRVNRKKFWMAGGFKIVPQDTKLYYYDEGEPRDTTAHVISVVPFLNLTYRKSKTQRLALKYRTQSGLPGMNNLMPIVNNNNPLNIRTGNPGLKPSMTHAADIDWNSSSIKKQKSFIFTASYSMIRNATSTSTSYDELTGVRTSRPENINGNWKTYGVLTYSTTFPGTSLSLTSVSRVEFQHNNSFLYNSKLKVDEVNTAGRFMAREKLDLSYRKDWFEMVGNAGVEYTSEKNNLRPQLNRTPYAFYGGAELVFRFPWKMLLMTDLADWSQRGYNNADLDRNYYIWNARINQKVMKGKATACFEIYDILHQQENMTRTFSSDRRTITLYSGVTSYIMFRFIYRLNR